MASIDEVNTDIIELTAWTSFKEVDESDDSFSRELILQYFSQADSVLVELKTLFEKRDLVELSKRAHYLKGSSAVVAIRKVHKTCETIQHTADREETATKKPVPEKEAIPIIDKCLETLPGVLEEARTYLFDMYKLPLPKKEADAKTADAKDEAKQTKSSA